MADPGSDVFRVMSWNVLTTHYARAPNGQPESNDQRDARHRSICRHMRTELPDVVLLQEADGVLFQASIGGRPPKMPGYKLYANFDLKGMDSVGTGLLARTDIWERDPDAPAPYQNGKGGSVKAHGGDWGSSSCCIVALRKRISPMYRLICVSIHSKHGDQPDHAEKRSALIKETLKMLQCHDPSTPVVFGGDFNVRHAELMEGISSQGTLLRSEGFELVRTPSVATSLVKGCQYDAQHQIDWVFIRGNIQSLSPPKIDRLPGQHDGQGPFGNDIGSGSDHASICITFGTK